MFLRLQLPSVNIWWQTIDRLTVGLVLTLLAISALMVATASPAVASRISVENAYFVKKHIMFLAMGLSTLIAMSLLQETYVKWIGYIGSLATIVLLLLVLVVGVEAKGATRWLHFGGFSLQPSEFAKPFLLIATSDLLSRYHQNKSFPGWQLALMLFAFMLVLIVLQPDFGMSATISMLFGIQLFLAGLTITWVIIAVLLATFGVIAAYWFLPHVTDRIDKFLNLDLEANYQVKKSLSAIANGGWFGTGPGEGVVKQHLPDSHTDFIFPVMVEELGIIAAIIIIGLYAWIIHHNIIKLFRAQSFFSMLAISSLIMIIAIQTIFNVGVALNVFPTTGMTLPFISYGGSSLLSSSITVGAILALTRKRFSVHTTNYNYLDKLRRWYE